MPRLARRPDWHSRSVVYEIFPDRFATTGAADAPPPWGTPWRGASGRPGAARRTSATSTAATCGGIEAHLDHLERLGANVLYMTPIFPAGTSHRYDAESFGRIDPLLGGDEAFRSLARAAHERGLRLIGDLTLEPLRLGPRVVRARARRHGRGGARLLLLGRVAAARLRGLVRAAAPAEAQLGARRSFGAAARRVRHWLEEGLDGWRIDVANMAGRYRGVDLTHDLARAVREAASARADACSSPSTRTTSAPTCAATAGTGR